VEKLVLKLVLDPYPGNPSLADIMYSTCREISLAREVSWADGTVCSFTELQTRATTVRRSYSLVRNNWNYCRLRRWCNVQSGSVYLYQLFTIFVPFADSAFPVLYALMSRKTCALYVKVFEKVKYLVPQFVSTSAMVDFQEASVSAFRQVFWRG